MILDEIINRRMKDVKRLKEINNVGTFIKRIEEKQYHHYSFKDTLVNKEDHINIIAEIKRASPSKGVICENFSYLEIAKAYKEGGASAISVLTEPYYFKGDNRYLSEIKERVSLPLLRKDFIIDEIQIYESKAIGADAILLIVAALTKEQLTNYIKLAKVLELDTLVEVHDEQEMAIALVADAEIIGVNNRNLRNFEVQLEVSERLSKLIPKDKIFVSESGIKTKGDVERMIKVGADALLIGESILKEKNPGQQLRQLLKVG